jgi:phage host-nuclease inhibitor protein Gam
MSDPLSAILEGRSASQSAVCDEIYTLFRPIEVLFTNRMEKAKADQEELIAKCDSLIHDIESIEGLLPPSALDEYTDKINGYCDRIEALHKRIAALNRRADNLLRKIGPAKGPKSGGA